MFPAEMLVVVAKYPAPARVKTRLGRVIGLERSAQLYRAMLQDLEVRLRRLAWTHAWAFDPPDAPFAALLPPGARCFPSGSADLSGALRAIFARLDDAGCRRVVVISSDAPQLPLEHIDEAFERLQECDVVLGPTEDGGYSLVGQRLPSYDLFTPVRMSTQSVLRQTLDLCAAHGLSCAALPVTFDIDDGDDLRRLHGLIASGRCPDLPRTATLLEQFAEPS